MAEILGKVTRSVEVPRGADAQLRITVPALWLVEGRSIEIELPRNLTCANCMGGGCGRCNNSGAITLRERDELPEIIQVALPEQRRAQGMSDSDGRSSGSSRPKAIGLKSSVARPVVIRIPECGGLPESSSGHSVRGWLLLEVTIASKASSIIRLVDGAEPFSFIKMLRAEIRREPSAESSSGEPESVRVTKGISHFPGRRSGAPTVQELEDLPAAVDSRVQRGERIRRDFRRFVLWAFGLLVVAVTILGIWYWR